VPKKRRNKKINGRERQKKSKEKDKRKPVPGKSRPSGKDKKRKQKNKTSDRRNERKWSYSLLRPTLSRKNCFLGKKRGENGEEKKAERRGKTLNGATSEAQSKNRGSRLERRRERRGGQFAKSRSEGNVGKKKKGKISKK